MTRLTIAIAPPTDDGNAGQSWTIDVTEDYDRVLDLIVPLESASSALQARENLTLHVAGGARIFVRPETITAIEEDPS